MRRFAGHEAMPRSRRVLGGNYIPLGSSLLTVC
jgi:hypothetical protein